MYAIDYSEVALAYSGVVSANTNTRREIDFLILYAYKDIFVDDLFLI